MAIARNVGNIKSPEVFMKLVILDANSLGEQLDLSVFEHFGELVIHGFTEESMVVERIKEADIIVTNKVVLFESNLKYAPNLKLICVTGTGTNNIDKKYTLNRGITVSNVVNYSTESVAQHTFALLFYLFEHMPFYDNYVKSGAYIGDKSFGHYKQSFNELFGKTWGIIGLGNIGRRVAQIAEVFGCEVIFYSTSGKNNNNMYKSVSLNELLVESDIISIHAPLNEQTEHLLTYDKMKLMKKSAYLLNLGRGKIIKQQDLTRVIKEDLIAGAALDVLEVEPMEEDNPLLELSKSDKLLITPHIGWASIESRNRVIDEVYKNIESFILGKPRCVVTI